MKVGKRELPSILVWKNIPEWMWSRKAHESKMVGGSFEPIIQNPVCGPQNPAASTPKLFPLSVDSKWEEMENYS